MEKRKDFLKKVNKAFVEGDDQFLLDHVSEDFCWVIVGERTLSGKNEFSEALDQMKETPPIQIDIHNMIFDDHSAIVEGVVVGRNRIGQKKQFGFCDVYRFDENAEIRITQMSSYVIDVSKHKQYKEKC